eukprot:Pgem_evm1s5846
MSVHDIPLNVPIYLRTHAGNNLQSQNRWINQDKDYKEVLEQMIIIKTEDNKYIIQSRRNNLNLQVDEDGNCMFASPNLDFCEEFDIESDPRHPYFYFISSLTRNVLQCEMNGNVRCANRNRKERNQFEIVYPSDQQHASMTNSNKLLNNTGCVVGCIAVGALTIPLAGLGAAALVPSAMSYFGTVISGVGTIHAAGGVAATLQTFAAFSSSTAAVVGGAAVGAGVGGAVVVADELGGNTTEKKEE